MTRSFFLAGALAVALVGGCTNDVDVADTDMTTGNGAGAAGAQGSGATGPSAGGNGSGASGPGGGGAGGSASSGAGGNPGLPECVVDADCQMVDDCCACEAIPAAQQPADCNFQCLVPMCEGNATPPTGALCVLGVCVAGFDCTSEVDCAQPAPICAPGSVAVRNNGCWGGCAPATECASVVECGNCGPDQACVEVQGFSPDTHCVPHPESCGDDPATCGCAADVFCPDMPCNDNAGHMTCTCETC